MSEVYYRDDEITIRGMIPSDAREIAEEEVRQGWNSTPDKYEMRLRDQAAGRCVALAAEYLGHVAGYINVYRSARSGPFAGKGYPVIVDFGVLEKYRRRGVGTRLMDVAEEIAARYADTVCIGVGLHSGYGSAQRMYVKRGYVPDGSGVWYGDKPCAPYSACVNDDELVLYMSRATGRKTGP